MERKVVWGQLAGSLPLLAEVIYLVLYPSQLPDT